jgi:outer membrane protein
MNKWIKGGILSLVLMCVSFYAQAQKFGYVNSQEIISQLPEVKEANSNLETFGNQLQKKYQQMLQSLQTKYQDLERKQQEGLLSPKQLEEEAKKLKDEEMKLAQFEQSSQQQIMKKQEELLQPIMDRIQAAIKEVASENGYSYIFDQSMGVLLYADESTNISPKVKSKLGM